MSGLRFLTIKERVAAHLREQIGQGRWSLSMPGRHELARELEVSNQTAENAMLLLEKEGLLEPQGRGKRRRITLPKGKRPDYKKLSQREKKKKQSGKKSAEKA